ncbi:cilia- and flagella-associated protein 100-like isoform X2 [Mytilus californianus]|uniref:cilia- and flagella-associated protein 100-like isoform X2 n=1 Tax=Mytilus californianus TaxID=6549 RepID=UPI0022475D71|nr:cilia- and flagella-associated protein 100-like isoform X2 [Mytilus californianus]
MGDSPTGAPSPDTEASGKKSRQDGSRQSGRVTFPNSAKSGSNKSVLSDDMVPQGNPFKMPPEVDIFVLRDKERQRKKQERLKQRELKVHEKTTYASKVNFRTASMIRPADSDEDGEAEDSDKAVAVKDDPQFTIAVTRDRHVEKESLAEYIQKKREMFLVQYSLGVKRDEIRKLEEIAQAEEKKLEQAELYLEEDASMFDEFLKENDTGSVEAVREYEGQMREKQEKVAMIKAFSTEMSLIRSQISNYEDLLREFKLFKKFLEKVTPQEIREEQIKRRDKRREEKKKEREAAKKEKKGSIDAGEKSADLLKGRKKPPVGRLQTQKTGSASKKAEQAASTPAEESSDDDELELFFAGPQQLLDIFAELEEQNLSLIQNSQETEENLEEMKTNIKQTKVKMEKETAILKEQISKLTNQIKREESKAQDLKIRAKMFSFGEFKQEDQEKMLLELNRKVEDVYKTCIGDNEAQISTLQMLTNLENQLVGLLEQIETMPADKVEAAEKAKEKERRLKMREEKMEEQRLKQEERVRKAMERARAEPKKQTGRKLVFRSEPPKQKKREDDGAGQDSALLEEEQYLYHY